MRGIRGRARTFALRLCVESVKCALTTPCPGMFRSQSVREDINSAPKPNAGAVFVTSLRQRGANPPDAQGSVWVVRTEHLFPDA
jgi:hypothetical protein